MRKSSFTISRCFRVDPLEDDLFAFNEEDGNLLNSINPADAKSGKKSFTNDFDETKNGKRNNERAEEGTGYDTAADREGK